MNEETLEFLNENKEDFTTDRSYLVFSISDNAATYFKYVDDTFTTIEQLPTSDRPITEDRLDNYYPSQLVDYCDFLLESNGIEIDREIDYKDYVVKYGTVTIRMFYTDGKFDSLSCGDKTNPKQLDTFCFLY